MLGADWREVVVQTTGLTPGQSYTLNVSGVRDQTVSLNQIVTTNITFRAPLLTQGLLVWDYYYLGSVSLGVPDLTGNPIYPNAPMTNGSSSSFDTTPITGGDLRNKGYGALGDNYGDSLSGWITPTVSGDYTFFLNTDDASELWLSGTADPAGASLIAYDLTCCHPFQEKTNVNVTYTSDPVPLVKDQSYFIRALHTEGGGGDYLRVAWRIAGATNAPSTLLPIPAAYLSSYAPGPIGFKPLVFSGGQLTISWTGTATLLQSTNVAAPMSQWAPAANTSPYTVTPSGPQMFYRLTQ
jgi:hypothetical protein